MVHIIISALVICGTGFFAAKASQSTNITAQPGDNVIIWCQHTSEIGNNIHWFKQSNSAVPLSIVYMMLPYELEVKATYLNGFQPDRLVMSLNSKNTSLRISNVNISDSGLYYCGWQNWVMTFGDGTHLDIKERSVTPLQNQTETTNKDLKKSPISTSDCSENIFYKLTFIFGGIIVILIIILLTTLIIKIQDRNKQGKVSISVAADAGHHETQPHEEPHSSVYAALQFSKHKSRRAARNTEYTDVVYSATR
uniref:Ig-like domain-containing protein n=1 Tax=Cyprinus carpio TaxID=7962 RepID=A0A8C1WYC9_CYPCA